MCPQLHSLNVLPWRMWLVLPIWRHSEKNSITAGEGSMKLLHIGQLCMALIRLTFPATEKYKRSAFTFRISIFCASLVHETWALFEPNCRVWHLFVISHGVNFGHFYRYMESIEYAQLCTHLFIWLLKTFVLRATKVSTSNFLSIGNALKMSRREYLNKKTRATMNARKCYSCQICFYYKNWFFKQDNVGGIWKMRRSKI